MDQGMVVKIDKQTYYGVEAVRALAQISSRSGMFNRLNYWLFRSKWTAKMIYPILKVCRNLLLKILGKTKINNLQKR